MNIDLLPRSRVTDDELARTRHAIEIATAQRDELRADADRRGEERQRVLAHAEASDADIARLELHRSQLLEQLRADPSLTEELAKADAEIASLRRRAGHFREAAATMPAPNELNAAVLAATTKIREDEAQLALLQECRRSERLLDALAAVEPVVSEWLSGQTDFEPKWRAAFGQPPPGLGDPYVRLARLLSWWAKDLLGPRGNMIERAWPREAAPLLKPLEQLRRPT